MNFDLVVRCSWYPSPFVIAFDWCSLFHAVRLDLALRSWYTTLFVVVHRSFGFLSHLTAKSSLQVCSLGLVLCCLYFAFLWLNFSKLEIYVVMVLFVFVLRKWSLRFRARSLFVYLCIYFKCLASVLSFEI
jgi:hypothetical protein